MSIVSLSFILCYTVNMGSYILVGNLEEKNEFIKEFIKKNNIPSYNIYEYDARLKISDAREIKKNLGVSSIPGKMRLFIIRDDPTVESQQALLKSIEELPEDVGFIFVSDRELLPTMISRASVINLGALKFDENHNLETLIDDFAQGLLVQRGVSSLLSFTEELFLKPDLEFEELILAVRKVLLKSLHGAKIDKAFVLFRLLKALSGYSSLVYANNLNKKILTEKVLINEFSF